MSEQLYASVTGISNPINITVSTSHSSSCSTAAIECLSHSLNIGDSITVDLGFVSSHGTVFTGYVKQIDRNIPNNTYIITAHDVLIRAVDYFVASSNPDNPFSRNNISAEDLVRDVLALAGITNYSGDTSHFTLAINTVAEVNLVGAHDYCKGIADLIAWHLYADINGQVHFLDRKPYVMGGDSSIATLDDTSNYNILSFNHRLTERELRNRVVVYGSDGVYAEAKSSTSYNPITGTNQAILPSGYYKTAVAQSYLITVTSLAQDAADYNLDLYNRLQSSISLSVLGNHNYLARKVITVSESITGISSSQYYIFLAEHSWGKDGYVVNMELRK